MTQTWHSSRDRGRRQARRSVPLPVAPLGWALLVLAGCGGDGPARAPAEAPAQVDTAIHAQRTVELFEHLDPGRDGWESEALASRIDAGLAPLKHALEDPSAEDFRAWLAEGLAVDFRCTRLWPSGLEPAFDDGVVSVQRGTGALREAIHEGPAGLRAALAELRTTWGAEPSDVATKFKVVGIDPPDDRIRTRILYESHGRTAQGRFEQSAHWTCEWEVTEGAVRLASIEVEPGQFVVSARPEGFLLDCTEAVLGGLPAFTDQLDYGRDHWARHVEALQGMDLYRHCGLAVGDADGDGLDDVYVCQPSAMPNRLFLQNEDGTARDASSAAGVDWLDHTSSALFVDLDGDGDQDLALATRLGLLISANDGSGRFEPVFSEHWVRSQVWGLSAADPDLDGDLDLYTVVNATQGSERDKFNYIDANDGGANLLFRNDTSGGHWSFVDVTRSVGLDVNNRRRSLAAAWDDYDADGDPDLYVANDYGQNCLYRNDGGHFEEVAEELGVIDFGSGMSACWGDYDRDGRRDLYVSNMFSAAGNRITTQPGFRSGIDPETRAIYTRFAKGNTLFRQLEDGSFQEVGAQAGVEMGRWAWSSVFADIDNDGWEDILVANGYITTENTNDL